MNYPRVLAILALGVAASLHAPSASAQMNAGRTSIAIATATPTGNYFTTGNAICRALQRQGHYLEGGDVTLLNCGAIASSGSIQNVELLRSRAVDVALMQSDWQHHAYTGADRFKDRPMDRMRSLIALNEEAFQVVAARATRITSWPDLKGKKVNLGPSGSTSFTMFLELLKAHAVDESWLAQSLRLPPTQHVQEMCEGNIEVLGQTSGVPNAGINDVTKRCGADFVRLDTPQIKSLVESKSYYTAFTIAPDTYAGQRRAIPTFAVAATLVTTTDLPESLAYSIVRAIVEGLDDLQASVPVLRSVRLEAMAVTGLSAPLHPGAIRYFKERGIPMRDQPTAPPLARASAFGSGPTIPASAPSSPAPSSPAAPPAAAPLPQQKGRTGPAKAPR